MTTAVVWHLPEPLAMGVVRSECRNVASATLNCDDTGGEMCSTKPSSGSGWGGPVCLPTGIAIREFARRFYEACPARPGFGRGGGPAVIRHNKKWPSGKRKSGLYSRIGIAQSGLLIANHISARCRRDAVERRWGGSLCDQRVPHTAEERGSARTCVSLGGSTGRLRCILSGRRGRHCRLSTV